jgi:hypothetical protein
VSAAPATDLSRARRLRAPLLVALGVLLAFEAGGGLVIFFARLATGSIPGEALHVFAGVALTLVYAAYQWSHWSRVAPYRARLDYTLGLIAALSLALAQLTGLALAWPWWQARGGGAATAYPPLVSAAHNVMSMFVLTFVGAHLGAVLQRDARARSAQR